MSTQAQTNTHIHTNARKHTHKSTHTHKNTHIHILVHLAYTETTDLHVFQLIREKSKRNKSLFNEAFLYFGWVRP